MVLTIGRLTGETGTGTGVLVHITERHHLDVDGSTPRIGDVVHLSVEVGSLVIPRAEDRFDRGHELLFRIGRELFSEGLEVVLFVLLDQDFEILDFDIEVILDALSFLDFIEHLVHLSSRMSFGDVSEHKDETSIAVIGESFLTGLFG